jgi:hypothetical protein
VRYIKYAILAVFTVFYLCQATEFTFAADLPDQPVKKAASIFDLPFFTVNDNRLTYAYQFSAKFPGNTYPGGRQVLAFTHFDTWAYGTNFVNLVTGKWGQNAPGAPCMLPNTGCGGMTDFIGVARSTLGFNEIFNTKAFSIGPMNNVSFAVEAAEGMLNNFSSLDRRGVGAGLQFSFDLPYHGYINFTPEYYKVWQYTTAYTAANFDYVFPGAPSGWLDYDGTWALNVNYYMDLGFLPEYLPLAISGRATVTGPMGTGAAVGALPAPFMNATVSELDSEPIRITLDLSRVLWGKKYSHLTDIWAAYKYQRNILGLDNEHNPLCAGNTCTVSTLYTGITVKF